MLLVVPSFGVWSAGEKAQSEEVSHTNTHPCTKPESRIQQLQGSYQRRPQKKPSGKDIDVFPVE